MVSLLFKAVNGILVDGCLGVFLFVRISIRVRLLLFVIVNSGLSLKFDGISRPLEYLVCGLESPLLVVIFVSTFVDSSPKVACWSFNAARV